MVKSQIAEKLNAILIDEFEVDPSVISEEKNKIGGNYDPDKRKIELKEPIKSVGNIPVIIKLHPEVSTQIHVDVIAE